MATKIGSKNSVNVDELIDAALGLPESGIINSALLQCILHILTNHLNLENCMVQF